MTRGYRKSATPASMICSQPTWSPYILILGKMNHLEWHEEERVGLITNIFFPVNFSPSCIAMGAYFKRAPASFGARVLLIQVVFRHN
jgi:hypothetical protein